jgi:hypothetical protein
MLNNVLFLTINPLTALFGKLRLGSKVLICDNLRDLRENKKMPPRRKGAKVHQKPEMD